MKVIEIVPFLDKTVEISMKDKKSHIGYLSNTISSLDSPSGEDEVDLISGDFEVGIKINEIKTIRVIK